MLRRRIWRRKRLLRLLLLVLFVIAAKFKRFVRKTNSRVSFSLSNMRRKRKKSIWETDFTCFTSKVSISWCLSISFRLTNHESNDFYSLFPYPLFVFMNLFNFPLILFQLFFFLSNNILDVFRMSFLFLTNFNSTHLIIIILFRKFSSNKYLKKSFTLTGKIQLSFEFFRSLVQLFGKKEENIM